MKKKIFLSSPTIHGEEMEYIQEAFATNWVAPLGKNVDELEKEVSQYLIQNTKGLEGGSVYAAALSAGTAALHLALINENVGAEDIVFCSDLTFSASCNPIRYQNAVPVFIDSERDSWNMDPEALKKAFKKYPQAKAVIVVNLYGTPAKLDEIVSICKEHNVPLIEDAAESFGASYQGRQTGTFGLQSAISFNGNKIITTSGGGMLLSKDENKIKKARFLATQAREPERHYEHKEIGYNYRMSNIVAGIGRGQMLHLKEHIAKKKELRCFYEKELEKIKGISLNPILKESEPNYWLTCMLLSPDCPVKPLDIMIALEKENIESRPIWKPMHLQPVFQGCDFITLCETGSISEDIFNRGVCLPSDIKNTEEDRKRIVEIIKNVF